MRGQPVAIYYVSLVGAVILGVAGQITLKSAALGSSTEGAGGVLWHGRRVRESKL